MTVLTLFYHEAIKTFLKKRTYLGFLIILIVVPLVEAAMKIEGGRFQTSALRSLQQDFFFVGNLFNGWVVAHQLMNTLWVHIPLLISFVAGDQLAGEATAGTYRLILIRPVSRTLIFFSKYLVTLVYTFVFVSFLGVLSVGLAVILIGTGDLIVFDKGILILPGSDVAWRFFTAYILATWSMVCCIRRLPFLLVCRERHWADCGDDGRAYRFPHRERDACGVVHDCPTLSLHNVFERVADDFCRSGRLG
ncbi:MAG: ABC transporter permease [Ignavibacteriales bacterium]|nr:ABC transporter permease [Ignavibacteriales bacterium]